jgi:hypothetical protein
MSKNPYLESGPGLVVVTMTVDPPVHGAVPTVFTRYVNPLDYDYEQRLVGGMAHDALTHRDLEAYPFIGHGDEALALLQTAKEEWPAGYCFATVTVDGVPIIEEDARELLETLEFLAEHPEKDTHWRDSVVTG